MSSSFPLAGNRSHRFIFGVLTIALGCLLGSLSSSAARAEDGVTEKKVVIGQSTALTGSLAPVIKEIQLGFHLYLDKINAAGGVNGRKLELVTLDDGYEPKRTVENVKALAEKEKVFALMGTFGSSANKAILPLVEKYGLPLIGMTASTEELRTPLKKNVFPVRASSQTEMAAVMRYVVEKLGIREIGIIYNDNLIGTSMRLAAVAALHQHGLKFTFESMIKNGTEDFSSSLSNPAALTSKAILMAMQSNQVPSLAKKLRELNVDPILIGNTTHVAREMINMLGDLRPKIYATSVVPLARNDSSFEIVKQYLKDAKAAGVTPEDKQFEAYVNANVFVEALRDAGPNPTRDGLRAALEKMKDRNFGGLKVTYSKEFHGGMSRVFINVLKNGEFTPVASD